jgi:hypothetical protein
MISASLSSVGINQTPVAGILHEMQFVSDRERRRVAPRGSAESLKQVIASFSSAQLSLTITQPDAPSPRLTTSDRQDLAVLT